MCGETGGWQEEDATVLNIRPGVSLSRLGHGDFMKYAGKPSMVISNDGVDINAATRGSDGAVYVRSLKQYNQETGKFETDTTRKGSIHRAGNDSIADKVMMEAGL